MIIRNPRRVWLFGPGREQCMATGDQDGVIAVRSLSMPNEASGQIQTKTIMRLKHVGPVRKLAFSPDGRILAALAWPSDAHTNSDAASSWNWAKDWEHPGVIRLWVTKNWELGDDVKEKPPNTQQSPPM